MLTPLDGARCIPRGGTRAVAATDKTPEVAAIPKRLTLFNLDTLEPAGEISGVGGNGCVIDPKSGHGFTSDHPKVSMFDTKMWKFIKTIDVGAAQPDGIYFDAFNQRVYIFSHPTKDATVIDAKDGTVLGTIDLGGVPEQGVGDGKGMLYVVMQDAQGSVTAVDVNSMKATAHYPFGDKGRVQRSGVGCEKPGACSRRAGNSGNPPCATGRPAHDGDSERQGRQGADEFAIGGGGSDGATFNPEIDGSLQHAWQRHVDRD